MKTSLDHLPEAKQQELQTISTILRDTLDDYTQGRTGNKTEYRIQRIILFGSHAKGTWVNDPENGYISDYDILVIVNKPALVEEDIVWFRAEEQIARKVKSAPLGLIVHDISDVNTRLSQGHYFFKDIREEGIELFSTTLRPLARPGNLTEDERREIAQKHCDQWHSIADSSLKMYQFAIKEPLLKEAAFNLHQVTERLYSCMLLVFTNYLPKTHNIEKLQHLCIQLVPELTGIFPLDSKFHRRSFRRLQRAYVEARYSAHYEITKEELTYLETEVLKLRDLVGRLCRDKLV